MHKNMKVFSEICITKREIIDLEDLNKVRNDWKKQEIIIEKHIYIYHTSNTSENINKITFLVNFKYKI